MLAYSKMAGFLAYLSTQRRMIMIAGVFLLSHYVHYYTYPEAGDQESECAYFPETPQGKDLRAELESLDQIFERENEKLLPKYDKFIYGPTCAGLGNQLYKYASLYGLGIRTQRQPIFSLDEKCQRELEDEMSNVFYNFYSRMHFYSVNTAESTKIYDIKDCCEYVVPNDLTERKEHLVRVNGALQNYRYFHNYREHIRVIFRCNPPVIKQLKNYNRKLIGRQNLVNPYHKKICIHTRLGDFVHANIASSLNYTTQAIDLIINEKMRSNSRFSFSILLLGIDINFLETVKKAKESEKINAEVNYHIPKSRTRGLDMCYGIHTCDTILMTAGASTFSWWMAYLSNATIYYNPNFKGQGYSAENFLPEWQELKIPGIISDKRTLIR